MRLRIGALLLFAIAATAAIALWRDPFLLVRGEFARDVARGCALTNILADLFSEVAIERLDATPKRIPLVL